MSNCISGFVYLLLYLIILDLYYIYGWKYDISEKKIKIPENIMAVVGFFSYHNLNGVISTDFDGALL